MCNNFGELEFQHFVVVTSEGTIFGSARENGDGRTYNFLIRKDTVYGQEGDQWVELDPEIADIIRSRAQGVYDRAPVYKTRRIVID